jgi:hypothetical protein
MSNSEKKVNAFDELLVRRAQGASGMPWLETRVLRQVEYREQAKQWLRTHPGGLEHKPPQPLRVRLWGAVCALASARSWPAIGVALGVAGLVYLLAQLTLFAPALQSTSKYGGVYMLGAVLMVLAVALLNWPRLRQFYG